MFGMVFVSFLRTKTYTNTDTREKVSLQVSEQKEYNRHNHHLLISQKAELATSKEEHHLFSEADTWLIRKK